MGQSSGECVQGVKTPCAFNQHVFSNFFKSLKIRTAWRKDFFDTLSFAACGKANDMQLATTRFRAAVLPLDRERETALFDRLDAKRWNRAVSSSLSGGSTAADR